TSSIGISTASSGSTIGGRSGSSTGTVVDVASSVGPAVGSDGSDGDVGSVGSTLDPSVGGVVVSGVPRDERGEGSAPSVSTPWSGPQAVTAVTAVAATSRPI